MPNREGGAPISSRANKKGKEAKESMPEERARKWPQREAERFPRVTGRVGQRRGGRHKSGDKVPSKDVLEFLSASAAM